MQQPLLHRILQDGETEESIQSAQSILNINALLNALASFITLVLMAFMWRNGTLKFNLFIKCVVCMTICQCWYDSALPFIQGDAANTVPVWGGMCVLVCLYGCFVYSRTDTHV